MHLPGRDGAGNFDHGKLGEIDKMRGIPEGPRRLAGKRDKGVTKKTTGWRHPLSSRL